MYALEIYGLTKRFGKTTALDEVNLTLYPDELLTILGPVGSGKTTLLRLISGLDEPDQGTILINGKQIVGVPTTKNPVSMLFQDTYGLIPHLNVTENIAMPLRMRSSNKKEVQQLVLDATKVMEISHLLERKVTSLTKGEQLRVALARALVKVPLLLLLDNIFFAIDTPTRLAARRMLVNLQQSSHLPCLFATSDQPDAFALSDHIVLLNEGKIQQVGTRAELLHKPATVWVAQWMGFPPMNTLTGVLQGSYQPEGLCYRVWAKGFAPLLPPKWTPILNSAQSQEIVVGIRPENVLPEWEFPEKWKPTFYTIKAEIQAREWDQGKTLAQLRVPNTDTEFLALFDISHDTLQLGQIITVAFDPEQFCLFHAQKQTLLHAPPIPPALLRKLNSLERRPFRGRYVRGSSLAGLVPGSPDGQQSR
jgi:multiple sugar transport system ATP-binding protein